MRSISLILLCIISLESFSGTLQGRFADLHFENKSNQTNIFIKNNINESIVCKWGINGYQWKSYLSNGSKTDSLHFNNNIYNLNMVSWSCQLSKKEKIKNLTSRIYLNKYH